mgnify:CR=1 FL=1
METEKANGQYGKQNPLFMYQGTAGYSIRAELHGSKGGVEAAEAFTAVPQRARPLRYDAINNRERRKTEHGVFYRQIPE